MLSAGQIKDRITLQAHGVFNDGYGNEIFGLWEDKFTVSARVIAARGRETATTQYLHGLNPVDDWVRWLEQTKTNQIEWRAVDVRDPSRVFAILSVTDPKEYRRQLRLLSCTLGGAS